MALAFVKGIDRVTLGLDRDAEGLRVLGTIHPLKLPPPTPGVVRPGMPAGVVARLDVACPPAEAWPLLQPGPLRKFLGEVTAEHLNAVPERREQLLDVMTSVSRLFFGADATSIGVEPRGGGKEMAFHVVNQYARPVDVMKDMRDLAAQIEASAREMGDQGPPVELTTYQVGNTTVNRVTLIDRGKPFGYVDLVQRERTVWISISPSPRSAMGGLLAAKPEGEPVRGVAGGFVELGRLVDLLADGPGRPLAKMRPEQVAKLRSVVRGHRLALSASREGDGLRLDVGIPNALLKEVGDVRVGGGGAGRAQEVERERVRP
jgi:hypothetical protein